MLQGKKVYILGALAIVYAITGFITGHLDQQAAIDAVWAGLVAIAGRHAIATK